MIILTGEVHTGKTTSLQKWAGKSNHVGGFLSPIEGEFRILKHLASNKKIKFEIEQTGASQEETIEVGKFCFLTSAFKMASDWFLDDMHNPELNYLVLDEIGKLEMNDIGFHDLFKNLLVSEAIARTIIVVREYLVISVINKYNLEAPQIIYKNDLNKI